MTNPIQDGQVESQEATVSNQETVQPVQPEATTLATDPLSALPEDIRGQLGDIKDIENLAKGYVNAQSMIGNSVRIPSEDASKEAVDAFYQKLESIPGVTRLEYDENGKVDPNFYNKLGRPESADQYKFEAPQGIELDADATSDFAQHAHRMGLTQAQANELLAFEVERVNKYNESIVQQAENAQATLKQKWGADYETRLNGAKTALNKYAESNPEAAQELINSPAANNPVVIEMLSDLFGSLQESGVVESNTSRTQYGITPDEALTQINEIRENKQHPYHNSGDKDYRAAQQKMHKLYGIAYPDEG